MITEIIDFKTAKNMTVQEVIDAVDNTIKHFHRFQNGYVDTELIQANDENCWKMIHHYQSKADIDLVAAKVRDDESIKEFTKITKPQSIKVIISEQLAMWSK